VSQTAVPSQVSTAPPPPPSYPPSTSSYPYPQQSNYTRQFQSAYPIAPLPQTTNTYNHEPESVKTEPMNLSALLSSVQSSSPPSTAPSMPSNSIATLFSALLKAGVVSADSKPAVAGPNADEERTPPPSSLSRDSTRAYRKAILSEKIKLSTTDIIRCVVLHARSHRFVQYILSRKRPFVTSFLYDRLPAQCKQCGVRFSDDTSGKKAMDDHLDMHFRQNRKVNQNQGRGHSRSWFVNIEVSCCSRGSIGN
jgi:pre-mRNA cleavage complex 2 protein Pcf11